MYYPEELVEEIRSKNDIVDVVSGYVRLQKKGGNYWACCPFHNENTPSFSVSGAKQMYHCFGCGVSGNVFTFVMKYENFSFPEAVRYLAERVGVNLPEAEYTEEQKQRANRRARLMEVNREAAKFFYYQLRSPQGAVGNKYLAKRELSEETMQRFGLGYAGKNGTDLVRYLRQKGFEDDIIKGAGLASYSEKYGLVSQFWNRVMYPIQDINGRVIGFGGRVMGEGEPKYLNSPETEVFDKRRNLYGLNFARTARSGNIILCEGYMDVISMHQAGFTQAVASLGTAFTQEQANLLRKYTDTVLLAYDSDGAGVKAALRGIGILREAGLTKRQIREESRRAGLFTWNKPSYACLATRIPAGTRITRDGLCRTEWAEDYLYSLGFRDLRVRQLGNLARVQLPSDQMGPFLSLREEILPTLKTRYEGVVLDLEERNGQ